jgi:hypothetical protein
MLTSSDWPQGYAKPDSVAFGLEWTTREREVCDALGLAHAGTMPVTRRAPYVAIAVWGAPHSNPHIRKVPGRVGVASALTGYGPDKHRDFMRRTDDHVRGLLAVPPAEHPEWLRRVAFVLPERDASSVLAHIASTATPPS